MSITQRFLLTLSLFITGQYWLISQVAIPFRIEVKEVQINGMPALQSFVHGQYNGKWLLLGGRTDGLHQRQPFASFNAADNNTLAYVIDPITQQVWSASLAGLPTPLYEQLQSTNMQFEQVDTVLFVIGGYGYSQSVGNHITHNKLTAVYLPGLISSIINGTSINPHFRQLTDPVFEVTGGYLAVLNQRLYLAGGQSFTGRYNPHGPNHGPGFTQQYTNAIRSFQIMDNGQTLSLQNYLEWKDSMNLHRRDYNLAYQVFPDGVIGLTMFSGVFQHSLNIPWLNTIDIRDTGYRNITGFNQYLNQYHTAHMPVYDQSSNAMHTIFFGGMSRYTLDASGNLLDDSSVPFVNTISQVSRYQNGSLQEFKIGEMNGLTGSSAEFIAINSPAIVNDQGMILLDNLSNQKTLVGFIVGGIESTQKNIFFTNTGTQSDASNRVFKVFITKNAIGQRELMDGEEFFTTNLYPNPSKSKTALKVQLPHEAEVRIDLVDSKGNTIKQLYHGLLHSTGEFTLDLIDLPSGIYFLSLESGAFRKSLKLVNE